ncbi:MAG: Two-component hybrid sensor and regulator [Parcubacteria group bacterium GW2011_GWC1_41_7]|nr:MAG: Two-component hybrid sensor and regulator [Parcubacteria group bacterium GW2011_GWC1_41_7]
MTKFQKKFFRYFLVLTVTPVIILGSVVIYSVYFVHRQDVLLIEENLLNQKSTEILRFFEGLFTQLDVHVSYSSVSQVPLSIQQSIAQNALSANADFVEVGFLCAVDRECTLGTQTYSARSSDYSGEYAIFDRSKEFFSASQGKRYVSDVRFARRAPFVSIAEPVFNARQQVIGVVFGTVRLSQIENIVKTSVLGKSGYIYLFDKNKKLLAHSLDIEPGLGAPDENESTLHVEKTTPQLGWTIVAEWPFSEVGAIIWDIGKQILFLLLISLFIVFVVSLIVSDKMVRPIRTLLHGSKEIGQGNFNFRVQIKTGDELEDLGNQFNSMALSVQAVQRLKVLRVRQKYLRRALEKQKELSVVKDKFMTTVAHQLNTPLAVIGWSLESLKGEQSDEVKSIKESHKNLAEIVQDAIFLSDIGFAYNPYKNQQHVDQVFLHDALSVALQARENAVKEKSISWHWEDEVAAKNVSINGDKRALYKLFDYLIDNAIIYNKLGGTIALKIVKQNGYVVSIKDTGIGIPKEDQSFIFQEVFRAKNAVEGRNVGTGMGLMISKIITHGHQGKIWFETREREGTTFFVSFPEKPILPKSKEIPIQS